MLKNAITMYFGADTKGVETKMGKLKSSIKSFAVSMGLVLSVASVKKYIDHLTELGETAQTLNMNVEEYQRYIYAAKQSGVETAALNDGLLEMQKRFGEAMEGTGQMYEVMKKYNLSMEDSEGKLKTNDQLLGELADLYSSLPNSIEKARMADQAFGGSAKEMVRLLDEGAEGFARLKKEADEYGAIVEERVIRAAEETSYKLEKAMSRIGAFGTSIASGVYDAMDATGNAVGSFFYGTEAAADAYNESQSQMEEAITKKQQAEAKKRQAQFEAAQEKRRKTIEEANQKILDLEEDFRFNQLSAIGQLLQKEKELAKLRGEYVTGRVQGDFSELEGLDKKKEIASLEIDVAKRRAEIDKAAAAEQMRWEEKKAKMLRDHEFSQMKTTQEKIDFLQAEMNAIEKKATKEKLSYIEREKWLTKAIEVEDLLAEKKQKIRDDEQDAVDKRKETEEDILDLRKKAANIKSSDSGSDYEGRGQASLSELVAGTRGSSNDQRKARRVQRFEERAKEAADRGNYEKRDELFGKADKLRSEIGNLKESDRILRKQEELQKKQFEELEEIKKQITKLNEDLADES